MFIKRYITNDMSEAMKKIRKELGPDAVILNSRPVHGKGFLRFFQKKMLEVTVAYEIAPEKNIKIDPKPAVAGDVAEPPERAVVAAVGAGSVDQLKDQLAQLRNTVKEFTEKIKIVDKDTMIKFSPEIIGLYNTLVANDVHDELARRIASDTQEIMEKKFEPPYDVVKQLIMDSFGDVAQIKLKKFQQNVVVFTGPTGVGKTTTLVKMAGYFMVDQNLKVGFINMDTYRVAAQQQLEIYAEILGIPLKTVYTQAELEEALQGMKDRDVILVDTAGKSSLDPNYRKELAPLIECCHPDEVLLTLSATTGYSACKEIITNYAFLSDYKIIITKTDEVSTWGNILNIVDFAKKPLAYITIGQSVPDDIEQADLEKITSKILGGVCV